MAEASMDFDREKTSTQRPYFLSTMIGLLAARSLFNFPDARTGRLFLSVLAAVVVVAAFGYLHYLLWGRSLSHQVEAEEQGRAEADDPDDLNPSRNGWH